MSAAGDTLRRMAEPPALAPGVRVFGQTPQGLKVWGRVVELIDGPAGPQALVAVEGCATNWVWLAHALHAVPDGIPRGKLAEGGFA